MKWLLVFLAMSVTDNVCEGPSPLLKHSDELYDSQEECEKAFKNSTFYKKSYKQEVVGVCLGPLKPMYLSPQQLSSKVEYPCK